MDFIKLEFHSSECNGWPTAKILFDDDIYQDCYFDQSHSFVELPIDFLDGEHILTVELYGKDTRGTVVDQQGIIIKDRILELLNIYVNDIKLPDFFKYNSVYKFNNQTYNQGLKWGCNGIWTWHFSTPILSWVLDEKIKHQEKYNQPEISYFDKIKIEETNLIRLEKQLACIKE